MKSIKNEVRTQVWSRVISQCSIQTRKKLRSRVWDEVSRVAWLQIWILTVEQIGTEIMDQFLLKVL